MVAVSRGRISDSLPLANKAESKTHQAVYFRCFVGDNLVDEASQIVLCVDSACKQQEDDRSGERHLGDRLVEATLQTSIASSVSRARFVYSVDKRRHRIVMEVVMPFKARFACR